jgi:hypothetical protein
MAAVRRGYHWVRKTCWVVVMREVRMSVIGRDRGKMVSHAGSSCSNKAILATISCCQVLLVVTSVVAIIRHDGAQNPIRGAVAVQNTNDHQ